MKGTTGGHVVTGPGISAGLRAAILTWDEDAYLLARP